VGFSTLLILALIVTLSVRLRKSEIYTMFTIGSSRGKVFEIITFELLILMGGSLVLAGGLYVLTGLFVDAFIYQFII
jgi:ABC-type antimicrobial peptide transport system permease subunit